MKSRREFLFKTLAAGGLAAAGGAGTSGCVRWVDPAPVVDVPAPVAGKISLDVSRYPDLEPLGSAITLRIPGMDPILVAHWTDGKYAALSSTCTHQGCPLGFSDGSVECPCHGARFNFDGAVINPPAVQGLKSYSAYLDGTSGNLIINLLGGTPGFPTVENGTVFFPFASYPQLQTAGGAVAGTPAGLGNPLVVVALAGGGYSALDTVCTHLGCVVSYSQADGNLLCPCHGSTFALSGEATQAPATSPLKTYPASADATGVTVTVG